MVTVECGPDSGPGAGAGTPDARLTRDRTGESKIIILTISFFCRYSIELTTAIYPACIPTTVLQSRRRERRVGAICSTTTPAPTGKSLTPAHRRPRAGYRARDVPPRANELRDVPPLPVCIGARADEHAPLQLAATGPQHRLPGHHLQLTLMEGSQPLVGMHLHARASASHGPAGGGLDADPSPLAPPCNPAVGARPPLPCSADEAAPAPPSPLLGADAPLTSGIAAPPVVPIGGSRTSSNGSARILFIMRASAVTAVTSVTTAGTSASSAAALSALRTHATRSVASSHPSGTGSCASSDRPALRGTIIW